MFFFVAAVKQVEELPDIPDDEVEIPDSIMDSVETLRQRKDVVRNVADEDVEKLSVFCFTGKGYQCKTCGFILNKETVSFLYCFGIHTTVIIIGKLV